MMVLNIFLYLCNDKGTKSNMNIKLHTPKSLKKGSGMSSMKQFLLSIVATSISIALTFGTAAIIDNKKKQKEKHEIVMMVLYDMYNSLKIVERADSMLHESVRLQLKIAEDTTQFQKLKFYFIHMLPTTDYTETTERIFSTSIETINTVGNVLFTENVANFYQSRNTYKTMICDTIRNQLDVSVTLANVKNMLNFDYAFYAAISHGMLNEMQNMFVQCQQMMDVSDEEVERYRDARLQMDQKTFDKAEDQLKIRDEVIKLESKILEAKQKLKLE